jgi:hypothetical protein
VLIHGGNPHGEKRAIVSHFPRWLYSPLCHEHYENLPMEGVAILFSFFNPPPGVLKTEKSVFSLIVRFAPFSNTIFLNIRQQLVVKQAASILNLEPKK